jgi:hypothetical protein
MKRRHHSKPGPRIDPTRLRAKAEWLSHSTNRRSWNAYHDLERA